MATQVVCFKCYMRARREAAEPVDLHNPVLRKEHAKLVKIHAKLVDVLVGLKVNDNTKRAVMTALRPYFLLVDDLINLSPDSDDVPHVDDDARAGRNQRLGIAPPVVAMSVAEATSDDDKQEFFRAVHEDGSAKPAAVESVPPADDEMEQFFGTAFGIRAGDITEEQVVDYIATVQLERQARNHSVSEKAQLKRAYQQLDKLPKKGDD